METHLKQQAFSLERPSAKWNGARWFSWIVSVILLVAVIVAVHHFSEERDFVRLAQRAQPLWMLFAIAFQIGTYVAQGQVFRLVAKAGWLALKLTTAWRLGLAKLSAIGFIAQADASLTRSPRLLLKATFYQVIIVLCDAASVWVLVRALGSQGSPSGVFASFMMSSLLRTIGFMPGGLGLFEAASVVTLRMISVPIAAALAATLLFRGLSFWLPMLPGLWFSRRELAPRAVQHTLQRSGRRRWHRAEAPYR